MGSRARRIVLGMLLLPLGLVPAMQAPALAQAPPLLTQWSTLGSDPNGIAVSASGNSWVADWNNRILRFSSNGAYLGQWGSAGRGAGQFSGPYYVALGPTGAVYVSDNHNHRIQAFNSAGTYGGQFATGWSPCGVAVDALGNVYVAGGSDNFVQKFNSNWVRVAQWNGSGAGMSPLSTPVGVAVFGDVLYVAEMGSHTIRKMTLNGDNLLRWGSHGSGNGQLDTPTGIAVDAQGRVYVVDSWNARIEVFSSNGAYLTQWGGGGTGDGQFTAPEGIAVDAAGNVYVSDVFADRIQKFGQLPTRANATTWGRLKRMYR